MSVADVPIAHPVPTSSIEPHVLITNQQISPNLSLATLPHRQWTPVPYRIPTFTLTRRASSLPPDIGWLR